MVSNAGYPNLARMVKDTVQADVLCTLVWRHALASSGSVLTRQTPLEQQRGGEEGSTLGGSFLGVRYRADTSFPGPRSWTASAPEVYEEG